MVPLVQLCGGPGQGYNYDIIESTAHMRSDSILFLEILPLSQELVDLMINNFPLALPRSVSLIIKVCEAK